MSDIPENLIDGQARAAMHPGTFDIPSRREIDEIRIGDHLKIGLEHDGGSGERFWVKVSSIPDGSKGAVFEGSVANDLVGFPEYPCQSSIKFEKRHILGVMPAALNN
jgi:hypothetical protein